MQAHNCDTNLENKPNCCDFNCSKDPGTSQGRNGSGCSKMITRHFCESKTKIESEECNEDLHDMCLYNADTCDCPCHQEDEEEFAA